MIRITSSIWSAQDSAQTSEEDLDFGEAWQQVITVSWQKGNSAERQLYRENQQLTT
jgi:hypothetical protein